MLCCPVGHRALPNHLDNHDLCETSMTIPTCSYNPPPPQKYPEYKFASSGSGTVNVTYRAYYLDNQNSHSFHAPGDLNLDASLEPLLNSFVNNISYFSRMYGSSQYGNLSWIGHDGGKAGSIRDTFHNVGKALDIKWIEWAGVHRSNPTEAALEVHDSNENWQPTTHRRLVAVEAGLRKWFGYVLNRGIRDHDNHFHVDTGCDVALRIRRGSRARASMSCHYFIQDCINAFTAIRTSYDGIWGASSEQAYQILLSDLGMECFDPVKYINHYMLLLDYIMMHGLADQPAGTFRWGDTAVT